MEKIYRYYNDVIKENSSLVKNLSSTIYTFGTIRLLLVAGAIITYFMWPEPNWKITSLIFLGYLIPFVVILVWDNKLSRKREYASILIQLCKQELAALDYDFSAFDGGTDKVSAAHSFSLDLDLFGKQSLFQSLNRTITFEGKETLANWLLTPLSDKNEIVNRQTAIQELSLLTSLRQHFYVTGSHKKGTAHDMRMLEYLTFSHHPTVNSLFWRIAIWVLPAVWIALFLLHLCMEVPSVIPSVLFISSVVISNCKIKQINKLHTDIDKADKILATYSQLIEIIEETSFNSKVLQELQASFQTSGTKASTAIKELSKQLNALDQRGNIITIIINIFTLRDIRSILKIEHWKSKHHQEIKSWFNALGEFDALLSLGGFAFNHPTYTYPEISGSYFEMKGSALGHPLLHRDVCICNGISIEKSSQFMIVTGANMAGKSTYLRTIGINYLLGCIGAPVFAKKLSLYPASLITSLRTSDSLTANESYFYAELKRLKSMIDRLNKEERLFIILDEILKGTNSIDKQKGSLALIRQFISQNTCGIIATHDLILGTLHDEYPDNITNYRFESDIVGDKLSFSYRLQQGVAQNLNACFLMQKMGIIIQENNQS